MAEKTNKLRVLVVGCGNMGASHATAYHILEGFEICGLVSRGASKEALNKKLGGNYALFDDYEKAGIRMLPSHARKTRFTGLQCMFYSIVLIPMAVVPRVMGMSGNVGMWIAIACSLFYFVASVNFYRKNDHKSAKGVMFTSFIYLPVVLLAFLFDKL